MPITPRSLLLTMLVGSAAASAAGAQAVTEVDVSSNITVSTTWTNTNVYNLTKQIYVASGATLTIQAGTVIASDTGAGGSLAVTRGSMICSMGTAAQPVIFTSKADVATWAGTTFDGGGNVTFLGDKRSGTARLGVNEWGNLTLMGKGYVSENVPAGNSATPAATNTALMEGLLADPMLPGNNVYGGGDDYDDSGCINYTSLRYGGKVIGLNNELNGLSMGGIGRSTDVVGVDIFNNVDDGVEIWGGAVNLKYLNIWNIGDDSVDGDQGWRGKGQYILIVQGGSVAAPQGSGIGDNLFEADGAEQSDFQPVTTSTFYNVTGIGQPGSTGGDHAVAYRDNLHLQVRKAIFMDLGERLVSFDNVDGDGGAGYGFNGTLPWASTWTTSYTYKEAVNAPAPGLLGFCNYDVQTSGNLNEITDSVFFRNQNASAYTTAATVGVYPPSAANDNVEILGTSDLLSPIRALVRESTPVISGSTVVFNVSKLDPRPQNEALTRVNSIDSDVFFDSTNFGRGAFAPDVKPWISGWTAADAYGKVSYPGSVTTIDPLNNVPSSLSTNSLPAVGNLGFGFVANNPTASCGVSAGSIALVYSSVGPCTPLDFLFGCSGGVGTLAVNLGTLLPAPVSPLLSFYLGSPVNFSFPIPASKDLCGATVCSQVVFLTPLGDIRLGSAVEWTIGN